MTTHTDGRACRVLRHTLLPPRGPHKQYDSRNLRGQTDRTGFVDTGKTAAVCACDNEGLGDSVVVFEWENKY